MTGTPRPSKGTGEGDHYCNALTLARGALVLPNLGSGCKSEKGGVTTAVVHLYHHSSKV